MSGVKPTKRFWTKYLFILQKRALRLIFFKKPTDSAIPLFIENNILPVTMLYYESIAHLMHDISIGRAPSKIAKMFVKVGDVHSHNTRSHTAGKLYTKFSRLELQKRSFSRIGVALWNKIPNHLKTLPKRLFKKEIRLILLDNLSKHGYQVEVSKLSFI